VLPPATESPAPRWEGLPKAAAQNGILYRTLLMWIQRGHIQAHRFGPRLLQVDLNELDKLRVPIDRPAGKRTRTWTSPRPAPGRRYGSPAATG
jgi:hypothetical protein